MAAKRQSKSGRGRRGKKTLEGGEDPIIESRLSFIAELMASFHGREQILTKFREKTAAGEQGFDLCERQIDRYIAEVRRRWRETHDRTQVVDKKNEIVETLRDIARRASQKISYTESGTAYENPDFWVMMQIAVNIAKIEGIYEGAAPTDGDLDTIINDLAAERASGNPQAGADRS